MFNNSNNNNNIQNNQQYNNQIDQPLLNNQDQQRQYDMMQQPQMYNQYQQQPYQQQQPFQQQQFIQQNQQVQNQPINMQIITLPNGTIVANPQIMYCEEQISRQKICDEPVGVSGIVIIMNAVLAQLQLKFTFIQLIGRSNLLSGSFLQQRIMMPMINENANINSQLIINGYVAYCCSTLYSKLRSKAVIILGTYFMVIAYLIVINLIIFNSNYQYLFNLGTVNIIYIIQIVLIIMNMIYFTYCTVKCKPIGIYIGYIFAIINQLFVCAQISCSFIVGAEYLDAYMFNIYASFPSILFLAVIAILQKKMHSHVTRLCILLSQLPVTEFSKCA